MKSRLLPVVLVLAPAILGVLARGAYFATANGELTASAGRVAPQEIASTLAADREGAAASGWCCPSPAEKQR